MIGSCYKQESLSVELKEKGKKKDKAKHLQEHGWLVRVKHHSTHSSPMQKRLHPWHTEHEELTQRAGTSPPTCLESLLFRRKLYINLQEQQSLCA